MHLSVGDNRLRLTVTTQALGIEAKDQRKMYGPWEL